MPQRNRRGSETVLAGRCPELRARRRIEEESEIRRIGGGWNDASGKFEKELPSVRDVPPSPRKDRHVPGPNDQSPKRIETISACPLRMMYEEEAGSVSPASSPRSSASDGALSKISLTTSSHDGSIGDVDLGGERGSRIPAAPPPRTDRASHSRPCSIRWDGGTRTGTAIVRPGLSWVEPRTGDVDGGCRS